MTTLRAAGALLTASRTDRILRYLLLPFGEVGRTNLGKITAARGTVVVPEDVSSVHLNLEHEGTRPVGKAVAIEETDQGLVAAFQIARTTAGDDLLTEAEEGLRPGVSVELDAPVIRAGRLIKAYLTGAGAVTEPAFPSAVLVAADAGELEHSMDEIEQAVADLEEAVEVLEDAETPADVEEAIDIVEEALDTVEGEDEVPEALAVRARRAKVKARRALKARKATAVPAPKVRASAPAAAPVGLRGRRPTPGTPKSAGEVFKLLAQAHKTGGQRKLLAALSDVVPGDILGIDQGQFVGELWSGRAYQRRYVPLFNHADLTSFEVKGWQWVTKPVVAAYAGDKGAVPSAAVETEPVTIEAERLAGAHDIDRKFRDFNDAGFWEAYYRAMTESYAQVSDISVLASAVLAAGPVIGVGTIPTGVSEGMTKIVDGALAVLTTANALPTFAVVAPPLYREILLTRNDDTLTYLNASLGLEDGTIQSFKVLPDASGELLDDQVLVGAREAATVHELGGESPIRVEAENIAQGGIDAGVFGYYAVNVHDEDALVLVGDEDQLQS